MSAEHDKPDLPEADIRDGEIARALHDRMAPMLIGASSPIQGNVIAMLLGSWIAGHRAEVPNDPEKTLEATRALRARLMMVETRMAFGYAEVIDQKREGSQQEAQGEYEEHTRGGGSVN